MTTGKFSTNSIIKGMGASLSEDTWVALSPVTLPLEEAVAWATLPDCGAVVSFSGVVREHSQDHQGVYEIAYEAYEEQAARAMEEVAAKAKAHWRELRRLALLHRVGAVAVSDPAVVVVASAPHRAEAFAAAAFCIDALKATVPIWKLEKHQDGESWGLQSQTMERVADYAAGVLEGQQV